MLSCTPLVFFNRYVAVGFIYLFLFSYHNNSSIFNLYELNVGYIDMVVWKLLFVLNDVHYNLILFLFLFDLWLKRFSKTLWFGITLLFFLKQDVFLCVDFLKNIWSVNAALTNGLSLIHPFFVYLLYIIVLSLYKIDSITYFFKSIKSINTALIFNFIALVLGSWWAQQELNWGGWWNWDFVEMILLIFLLKLLVLIHCHKFKFFFFWVVNLKNFTLYFVLFFLFVRWDIINSVHSFNTLTFLEKYTQYVLFFVLVFFSYYFIYNRFLKQTNYKWSFKSLETNLLGFYFNSVVWVVICFFKLNILSILAYETDLLELTRFLKLFFLFILFPIIYRFLLFFIYFCIVGSFICYCSYYEIFIIIPLIFLCFFIRSNFKKYKLHELHLLVFTLIVFISVFAYFYSYYYLFTNSPFSLNKVVSIWCNSFITKTYYFFYENATNVKFGLFFDTNTLKYYNYVLYFTTNTNLNLNWNVTRFMKSFIIITNFNLYLYGVFSFVILFYILKYTKKTNKLYTNI